jgi:hypothetical protein
MQWTQIGSREVGENGWEVRREGNRWAVVSTAGTFRWHGTHGRPGDARRAAEQLEAHEFLASTETLPSAMPDGGFPDCTQALVEILAQLAEARRRAAERVEALVPEARRE